MKTKLKLMLSVILCLIITGCKKEEKKMVAVEEKIDVLNYEFPEAKKEVKLTLDSIAQSVKDRDLDKLISFHAYSPKFTEFKNAEARNGGEENEKFERGVFGSVTEVQRLNFDNLKIAVYDNVANVTLHADFHLKFGEDLAKINEQMTLLFLKTQKGWKIVHEHHSELKKKEE